MARIGRRWIQLNWSNSECLRAEDIPYSSTQSIKQKIDSMSSGGSVSGIHIFPDEIYIDDNSADIDYSRINSYIPVIQFTSVSSGKIYFIFNFPQSSSNIKFDIIFTIQSNIYNRNIKLNMESFITNSSSIPSSPSTTSSETILITQSMLNNRYKHVCTNITIPSSLLTSESTIITTLSRDNSVTNNHPDVFNLMSVIIYT